MTVWVVIAKGIVKPYWYLCRKATSLAVNRCGGLLLVHTVLAQPFQNNDAVALEILLLTCCFVTCGLADFRRLSSMPFPVVGLLLSRWGGSCFGN